MPGLAPSQWHFDIDRYLDPILPPSPLSRLPRPAAHFLGYRDGSKPQAKLGNIPMVFSAFVGVFCSIIVIERVTHEVAFFRDNGAPLITGSFGAAAVLEFYAIESPLAQPRNAIFGQIISSLVGTAICKLFALSPNFESIRWLGGALACACATAAMALTGTVHPPAGATALLAVVDDSAVQLGWVLLPVVMLGCALMLCVALLVNNIQRRFPVYWWSPEELGRLWRSKPTEISTLEDGGKAEAQLEPHPTHHSTATLREEEGEARITIVRGLVVVPDNLYLTPEEKLLLESLGQRL